jgi:hypothetical protein
VDVVPKIVIGGGGGGNGSLPAGGGIGGLPEGLLTLLLSEKLGIDVANGTGKPNAEAERMKTEMRARIAERR